MILCYSAAPPDSDSDTLPDAIDNCPDTANTDQADCDNDGIGDLCDPDFPCPGDLDNDGSGTVIGPVGYEIPHQQTQVDWRDTSRRHQPIPGYRHLWYGFHN